MAPAVTATLPVEVPAYKLRPVSKDAFPDGIRTSGQHPPLYEKLKSYEEFPEQITGSTVWKKEDYVDNPERWVHRFSKEEATELGAAADAFMASGTPLTGITKVGKDNSGWLAYTHDEGQLPIAQDGWFSFRYPSRIVEWQRVHTLQRFPCSRMGQPQVCRCVYGSRNIPW